jgi:hypothetical protein
MKIKDWVYTEDILKDIDKRKLEKYPELLIDETN